MKKYHKILSRYFTRQSLPYWSVLLLDCLIVICSGLFIYALEHGASAVKADATRLAGTFALYLIPFIIGFRLFRTYSGVIRFSSFVDLRRIGLAMIFGLAVDILLNGVLREQSWLIDVSAEGFVKTAMLAMLLMWTIRIWVKSVYDATIHAERTERVFIYGVRAGGAALAKSINTDPRSPYVVSGFVTDGKDMVGKRLLNVEVYANDENLIDVMKSKGASSLVVSPLKADDLRANNEMVNSFVNAGLKILMSSRAKEWDGEGDLSYKDLKPVDVEDLLPRDKIEIDMTAVGNLLRGKRILITGAAGSIGSEMVRQIAQFQPRELILVDQAETPLHDIRLMMAKTWSEIEAYTIVGDIANQKRMDEVFACHKPEYVFHAAAYKHVPMMEDNPYESIENNINGTRIIADLAVKYGTKKFVMVSTDKAVNPTNVMGCSKRICEIYVQSLDKAIKEGKVKGETRFVTTRFGNVLGSNGSVIPLFERQIKAGGPVTVTHPDIIRFFMLIPEACKLVLEAGTMGNGGEIYVFDMGKPVRIADLAKRMIRMSGATGVEIRYTGLRDGEKLYEEVLNDKEITLPTFNEKIKIAKVREYDYADVNERIKRLIDTACDSDDMTIVAGMKALVPEFKSQHSKYEALDK